MKTSLKDWPKVYERIKNVRGLDEHEKTLYARSLAATPDERWKLNERKLKELGFWGRGMEGKHEFDAYVRKHGVPTWI